MRGGYSFKALALGGERSCGILNGDGQAVVCWGGWLKAQHPHLHCAALCCAADVSVLSAPSKHRQMAVVVVLRPAAGEHAEGRACMCCCATIGASNFQLAVNS